ncbi:indole-3-glycerol phosphate synthase [Phycisphaerales bacterium]|nr:indole-3-glycerol phosphate synthase [Phycisphaerales bacterium]
MVRSAARSGATGAATGGGAASARAAGEQSTIAAMTASAITLEQIVEHTRREVSAAKAQTPIEVMRDRASSTPEPRNFFTAVTRRGKGVTSVIAEIKRRSPSAGLIRKEYDTHGFRPEDIAVKYHRAGASAISCLTDKEFFGGDLSFIARIKAAVPLPVLRKDFIVDPWQLYESRAAGADAVLLIAECLEEGPLVDMLILAQQLHLTVLLEVHGMDNLLRVRPYVGFPHRAYALLGINNRDLSTMTVDLSHTLRLAELVEDRSVLVSESGINSADDLRRLRRAGVSIVLVGEHLMKQEDPENALRVLLG